MSVLVVGSIALDSVETPSGSVENEPGGSALYASIAASFFSPACVVAAVGTDFPANTLSQLERRGIDTRGISMAEGETFKWCGVYEADLNSRRSIFTELGVFRDFKPVLPEEYRDSPFIFLANIDPDLQSDVLMQVHSPRMVLCDTMNFWITGKRGSLLELLSNIDILFLNDEEAKQFSGDTNVLRAGRWLLEKGPRYIIIKKGEHGAVLFGSGKIFSVPAFPVFDVIDPTGAGDTFAGAVIGHLSGFDAPGFKDIVQSLIRGSVLASFCVEGFGARKLLELTSEDIAERTNHFLEMLRI